MKRVELLAPAGNFDCLKAAINNGADAVYLGGTNFSARAFATNFDNLEIIEAIKYAHLRNVKVYVTLNTLLNEYEIDNAYKQAKFLYENNVDAILVQDLGLFYRLRNEFSDFELHASTQMHIHNLSGIKVAKELGFKRVVLARESSLDLIKEACKQGIEIECFVHGAICVSYSGQCLLSSYSQNRSANKGMCAQCCRLKYDVLDENQNIIQKDKYALSPKDMCLVDDIPNLIEAGVSSFKIEGRMKSQAYVGYVTSIYRKAIDSYYEGKKYALDNDSLKKLKVLFNRGFTNDYLVDKKINLFNNDRPNHMGIEIGKVIDIKGKSTFIKLSDNVNQFDGIRILNNTNDTGLILNLLKVNGLLVNSGKKGQIIEIELKDKVNINDVVIKTQDYKLEKEIVDCADKKLPISLSIDAFSNKPLCITCRLAELSYKFVSDEILEEAIKNPIKKENLIDSFNKLEKHPYFISNIDINLDNCFISLKTLNDIRRKFYNSLDEYRLSLFKRVEFNKLSLKEINISNNESLLLENNTNESIGVENKWNFNKLINLNNEYANDFNVVKEMGGLLLNNHKIAYSTLNVKNSYALQFLLKLGFENIILSFEINEEETKSLLKAFNERVNKEIKPYVFMGVNYPLMNLKRNPIEIDNIYLKDNKNTYNLIKNKDYYELIPSNIINNTNLGLYDACLPFIRVDKSQNINDVKKLINTLKLMKK